MANALDMSRAQREAADQVYARLGEISNLLVALQHQADALATNAEFRSALRHEAEWLSQAQQTVARVRAFREWEMDHFWPSVWGRWVVVLVFATVCAAAAGAGYARVAAAYETDVAAHRASLEFAKGSGPTPRSD